MLSSLDQGLSFLKAMIIMMYSKGVQELNYAQDLVYL